MAVGYEFSNVVSFFRGTRKSEDWSAQELANFYRVEHVLLQNGLQIETDRGVTDEGDPWFVFCHSDGDVFLHFARIGGNYLVAGPNIPQPVWSKDFSHLLISLQDRVPLVVPPRERGGATVLMHPSVLLVAAVAALFFQSSNLKAEEAGVLPDVHGNETRGGSSKLSEFQVASLIAVIAFMASVEGLNSQSTTSQDLPEFEMAMALDLKVEEPLQLEDGDLGAVLLMSEPFGPVEAASQVETDAVDIATNQIPVLKDVVVSLTPEVDILHYEQQEILREPHASFEAAVQEMASLASFAPIVASVTQAVEPSDQNAGKEMRTSLPAERPLLVEEQLAARENKNDKGGRSEQDSRNETEVELAAVIEPSPSEEEAVVSWDHVKFFKVFINGIPVLIENTSFNLPNGPTADMVPLGIASSAPNDGGLNVIGIADSGPDAYAML